MKSVRKKALLFVFGTRPEALKLAPVIQEARKHRQFRTQVCLTAQHREMLDQVLELFKIKVDFDLKLMQKNQRLDQLTRKIVPPIQKVFTAVKPDLVIVQGDTTTAFVVALSAFYQKYPIAHVEAGLRSFRKSQPFPEEMNRVLISHLADYHFAPTGQARRNLIREGIPQDRVFVTGNTIVDSLHWMRRQRGGIRSQLLDSLSASKKLILVTAHRRESFGMPLRSICKTLRTIGDSREDIEIVYPVHLNPQVQKIVSEEFNHETHERIHLTPPLPYDEFLELMSRSYLILTDSGGIQEEAPSLGKPVLVMRDVSERQEGISSGIAKLVGTSYSTVYPEVDRLLKDRSSYFKMVQSRNPYGDGKASRRILNVFRKIIA